MIYTSNDLFTKHFLDKRLRSWPEWTAALETATEARARLIALFSAERENLPALKEKQLETRWVQPVLQTLGVSFEVGPALPAVGGTVEPDYALFASAQEMKEAESANTTGGAPAYFGRVRVLGDAKRWGTNFAASSGGRSPIQQIAEYLAFSGVNWGLLTDGRLWRLVHRSQASRWDQYYEVDLPACLESDVLSDFLYFYLFFSGDALRTRADGRSFLDAARRESREYAEAVGRELKEAVYEALRRLGRGFHARAEHNRPVGPDLLRRESLVLLYRLLFLLYAEHRRLLPLEEARYRDGYSFTRVTQEIAARLDGGAAFTPRGSTLWGRLRAIFEIVDHGDSDLGVPAYNGGLFSSEKHPLLAGAGPGDADLAVAIDMLARTASESRHFIDYRDLEIRHLGTIYEGLLEYRLEIAPTDLAVVATGKGKGERYEPFDLALHGDLLAERRIAAGDAYLVTDRGERKGTGSFYTPDFVVEHVVAETLGPLVAGKRPDEILRLRVLDPAMGSGHFLLEATEYLARAYGQARIAAGEDEDGILSEIELTEYRRLIAETCVYGVDLNPMAVELAKLALWLRTMAGEQALTFLDPHLKRGNSLIGARVAEIGARPVGKRLRGSASRPRETDTVQYGLFEHAYLARLPVMLADVFGILDRRTRSRADVELKETLDAAVEEIRRPFLALAHLYAADLCGTPVHDFENVAALIHQPGVLLEQPEVIAAGDLAATRGFFHWELAFPEVFYDRHGQPRPDAGFDAVIGNPPWIRQETLTADKDALAALFPEVFHGVADIYVYFVAAGLRLLAPEGRLGMVLPNKWLRADYGEGMRRLLSERYQPAALVDFGHAPIFPDADTFPCTLIVAKPAAGSQSVGGKADLRFCAVPRGALDGIHLPSFVHNRGYPVDREQLRPDGWHLHPPDVARLLAKIREAGKPLRDQVGTPYRGVLTGFNEAFLIDQGTRDRLVREDPGCDGIIKRFIRGENVERWCPRWGGEWMIALSSSENQPWPWADAPDPEAAFRAAYPSLHRHMKVHETALRKRQDQGRHWWELRSCAYYDRIEVPKLVYQEIQFHSRFAVDEAGLYLNNKAFLLSTADLGILAALNSSLMWWYLWYTAPHMKDEAFAMQRFYVEDLPVAPCPSQRTTDLIHLTAERQQGEDAFLRWLCDAMGLPRVTQKLETFWQLDEPSLATELKRAGLKPSAAAWKQTCEEFGRSRAAILPLLARARSLELDQHEEVFRLYGLTPADVALIRATRAPRDPLSLVE